MVNFFFSLEIETVDLRSKNSQVMPFVDAPHCLKVLSSLCPLTHGSFIDFISKLRKQEKEH